jgi:hypothetical protein
VNKLYTKFGLVGNPRDAFDLARPSNAANYENWLDRKRPKREARDVPNFHYHLSTKADDYERFLTNQPREEKRQRDDVEKWRARRDGDRGIVTVQGRLVKVQIKRMNKGKRKGGGGTRGKVTAFSKKSRKRLLEMFNRFEINDKVIFMTLTYGQKFPETKEVRERHRLAFLERLRRWAPEASGVWRIEYQKRGAPHFHFIMFDLPFLPKANLKAMWGEIIGSEYWDTSNQQNPEPPFTRIEAIHNPRHLMNYVSKYVAKLPDAAPGGGGFNIDPYLHAIENHQGRWWGTHNREKLPYAEATSIAFYGDFKKAAANYKRAARRAWKGVQRGTDGFTLFVKNSKRWLDLWQHYIQAFAPPLRQGQEWRDAWENRRVTYRDGSQHLKIRFRPKGSAKAQIDFFKSMGFC